MFNLPLKLQKLCQINIAVSYIKLTFLSEKQYQATAGDGNGDAHQGAGQDVLGFLAFLCLAEAQDGLGCDKEAIASC